MTPAEELRMAAQIIRERGWCKRTYVDGAGRLCIVGAINVARGTYPSDASKEIPSALRNVIGCRAEDFNNHHCAYQRDAIAALEIAADLAS